MSKHLSVTPITSNEKLTEVVLYCANQLRNVLLIFHKPRNPKFHYQAIMVVGCVRNSNNSELKTPFFALGVGNTLVLYVLLVQICWGINHRLFLPLLRNQKLARENKPERKRVWFLKMKYSTAVSDFLKFEKSSVDDKEDDYNEDVNRVKFSCK